MTRRGLLLRLRQFLSLQGRSFRVLFGLERDRDQVNRLRAERLRK